MDLKCFVNLPVNTIVVQYTVVFPLFGKANPYTTTVVDVC